MVLIKYQYWPGKYGKINSKKLRNPVKEPHLYSVLDTTSTLLSVTWSKLVSNLWNSHRSHTNLSETISIYIYCQHHLEKTKQFKINPKLYQTDHRYQTMQLYFKQYKNVLINKGIILKHWKHNTKIYKPSSWQDIQKPWEYFPTLMASNHTYLVNNTSFWASQEHTRISLGEPSSLAFQLILVFREGDGFADDNVITGHTHSRRNDTVIVQFVVDSVPHALTCLSWWFFKYLMHYKNENVI